MTRHTQEPSVKTILKYGYEYTLIKRERKLIFGIENPCFMGNVGYALQSFKKLNK